MRDTTGKGDGKKETLHEESTAEGQREQVMETLKKKLCWVNSEFEGSCHCFRTVKYIKRRIICKRHDSRGGQQEGDTAC